jgi:hypothetical protein
LLTIYYALYRETNRSEHRYEELESDERLYNLINKEMKSFFSDELGAKTWILVNNVVANKGANLEFHGKPGPKILVEEASPDRYRPRGR